MSATLSTPPAGQTSVDRAKVPPRRRVRWGVLVSLAVLIAGGLGIARSLGYLGSRPKPLFYADYQTDIVRRGLLRVTVNDDGNVESASNIDLKCEVDGGSQILWIAPLGAEVKKGDVLVRLNSSVVQEEITEQRIIFERANAELIRAETDLAVAAISLKEYEEGTFVKEQQTADANIVIARENLKSAENLAAHNERMFRKGYINRLQLEASEFAVERAKLDLDTMMTSKQVLVEFTRPKMVKELRSKQSAAEATFAAAKAAAELEKFKLDELNVQLEKCSIKAPQDGMVVYANQRDGRGRGDSASAIEEGAQVREMQSIIQLPDLSRMQVNSLIHETKVDKIRAGMPATIRIRGKELVGGVKFVNNQPEPGNWFSSDVKEYAAKISIERIPEGVVLKPGMTAEVEILVREIADALQVPLMAVVQEGLESVCYVKTPEKVDRRKVTIGDANTSFLEITEGLAKGEEVILNPRSCVVEAKERGEQSLLRMQKDLRKKARQNESTKPAGESTTQVSQKGPETSGSNDGAETSTAGGSAKPGGKETPTKRTEETQAAGGGGDEGTPPAKPTSPFSKQ
jgi:HlyD family secretion protein